MDSVYDDYIELFANKTLWRSDTQIGAVLTFHGELGQNLPTIPCREPGLPSSIAYHHWSISLTRSLSHELSPKTKTVSDHESEIKFGLCKGLLDWLSIGTWAEAVLQN
jgi:hypothetical protein